MTQLHSFSFFAKAQMHSPLNRGSYLLAREPRGRPRPRPRPPCRQRSFCAWAACASARATSAASSRRACRAARSATRRAACASRDAAFAAFVARAAARRVSAAALCLRRAGARAFAASLRRLPPPTPSRPAPLGLWLRPGMRGRTGPTPGEACLRPWFAACSARRSNATPDWLHTTSTQLLHDQIAAALRLCCRTVSCQKTCKQAE